MKYDIWILSEKLIYVKNYFILFFLEDIVNKEVNDMLKLEIVEFFEFMFCFLIVIVFKKMVLIGFVLMFDFWIDR